MLAKLLAFCALASCCLLEVNCQVPDPNEFCFGCQSRRNHKDLYANPADCHTYYQCFYNEDGTATGILRPCPPLTFWHDQILQCMPEGTIPCTDVCMNSNYNTGDCYADITSCSSYFVCDNTASVQFCCPTGTRFNVTKCGCDADETCTDICIQPTRPPTTEIPPSSDGVTCTDSFGNTLQAVEDNAAVFQVLTGDGSTFTMTCADGTNFSLEACRCDFFTNPVGVANTQCSLYLPFDDDIADHSQNRFTVFQYDNGFGSPIHQSVRGGGELLFNGGWLEIPGLKTFSPGKAVSVCLFYRCLDPLNCPVGGLFSNRKGPNPGDEYSFFAASSTDVNGINRAIVSLSTTAGAATADVLAPTSQEYIQICTIYDGTNVTIIGNNQILSQRPFNGDVTIGSCPFVVGTDQVYGNFIGYIDEVLVCPRAITRWEVNAHYAGRPTLQKLGLIPTEITFPKYQAVTPQPGPYGACGHSKYWNSGEQKKVSLQMYGGFDAKPDEFPWSVMLLAADAQKMCGGAVISPNFIITEGWCCANWLKPGAAGVGGVVVYYGVGETGYPESFAWNATIPPPQEYAFASTAKNFYIHPQFVNPDDVPVGIYDFCLVEVNSPVNFDSWKIQPICLPRSCDETCQTGDYDMLTGYGLLNGESQTWNFLAKRNQYNVIPLISNDVCQTALSDYGGVENFDTFFCAGYVSNGVNVYPGIGDDGTALSCFKKGYFSLDGIMSLQFVGEPSFFPAVYGKVCVVLDWIYSLVPQLKP